MAIHKETFADCDVCGRKISQGERVYSVSISQGTIGVDGYCFGGCSSTYHKHVCEACEAEASSRLAQWNGKIKQMGVREVTLTQKSMSELTWAEIAHGAVLHIGDEIADTLTTGEEVAFVVAGFEDGHTIFAMKDSLQDGYSMNEDWTNKGGWEACDMRRYLNETVFDTLPEDLREIIVERNADKLFLFSEMEVFGVNNYDKEEYGEQLPYFYERRNRCKNYGIGGSASIWWLRSPFASNAATFCYVYTSGTAANYVASSSYGVAFGFCV